jgi:hypothetical protein
MKAKRRADLEAKLAKEVRDKHKKGLIIILFIELEELAEAKRKAEEDKGFLRKTAKFEPELDELNQAEESIQLSDIAIRGSRIKNDR